jgi:hypothetical protein
VHVVMLKTKRDTEARNSQNSNELQRRQKRLL